VHEARAKQSPQCCGVTAGHSIENDKFVGRTAAAVRIGQITYKGFRTLPTDEMS